MAHSGRFGTRRILAVCLLAGLAGCSAVGGAVSSVKGLLLGIGGDGSDAHLNGFIGGVAADEPQAAQVGREILRRGGNAADAALATGLALSVTLPSRASLGAGGACLGFTPEHNGLVVASMFLPHAGTAGPGADRPAAVPMLLRGLFALQDRLGKVRFDELVEPAEALARRGFPVSSLLSHDLAVVRGPLFVNAAARAMFSAPDGAPIEANDTLVEGDLGNTLDQVRTLGPGALLAGALANRFSAGAEAAGGGISLIDLREARASLAEPIAIADKNLVVDFVPLPDDGGIAAAAAFRRLLAHPDDTAAATALSVATAAYARASGADAGSILAASVPPAGLPQLPASTSFVTLDRSGGAVACAVTMDNLFGTGRIAGDTGIVLAASPALVPAPLLPSAIAFDKTEGAFRAAVAASGQRDASAAAALALAQTLRTGKPLPQPVTEEGRVNVIACPDLLPGDSQACGGATDPRGGGLALGNLK